MTLQTGTLDLGGKAYNCSLLPILSLFIIFYLLNLYVTYLT